MNYEIVIPVTLKQQSASGKHGIKIIYIYAEFGVVVIKLQSTS